jgi:large subunit ribosomal protein L18Ae
MVFSWPQGAFKFHQYQVVGRHLPTEQEPNPTVYRMKVWAQDAVRAKSKFWCVCWGCRG